MNQIKKFQIHYLKIEWICTVLFLLPGLLFAAAKGEKEVRFVAEIPDPLVGDWQGTGAISAAQVVSSGEGNYQALLLSAFDRPSNVIAVVRGARTNGIVTFSGTGWSASMNAMGFNGEKNGSKFQLSHIIRE